MFDKAELAAFSNPQKAHKGRVTGKVMLGKNQNQM
jgi:hypothetical protein